MNEFVRRTPNRQSHWRSIVLFGVNVASYKFSLAHALLELADSPDDLVELEQLAGPFSTHLCRHLKDADKQGTSRSSRFLDACRQHNAGELDQAALIDHTVQLGFTNVLDAFHNVGAGQTPTRFFIDERGKARPGIRITDELRELASGPHASSLESETDARWRLVETAWELNLPPDLLEVSYEPDSGSLLVERSGRRPSLTPVRGALSGYQKGMCFYCGRLLAAGDVDVDHLIPRSLRIAPGFEDRRTHLDGVWNLVLSCSTCNRGAGGKFRRVPGTKYLRKLHHRNEYYITSAHPLRETIINQTGKSPSARERFLKDIWQAALEYAPHPWAPPALVGNPRI